MGASSSVPAICPACEGPFYIRQSFVSAIYWGLSAPILGVSLAMALLVWWSFPLTLWILLVARCPLRLLGGVKKTLLYSNEELLRRLRLLVFVMLPTLSAVGYLWEKFR